MRPTVPLVLGMLVGLAAGYLAGSHDSRSVARPIRVAESAKVATSNESGTAPSTELAAPPSPPRRPLPSALTFDLKDWLTRSTAHPAIVGVGFQPTHTIWDTLAFVYVRTGAVAELESVLVAALASAVPAALVEAQLSLVAPKEGLACLRRLRQAFPDLDWNEAAYARGTRRCSRTTTPRALASGLRRSTRRDSTSTC